MAAKRIQATISGRVQGVGYRYFAAHVAQRLGVGGTVRNGIDGVVEVVAEAEEATLQNFLAELRHGPSTATVTNMQVAWGEPTSEFSNDFRAVS